MSLSIERLILFIHLFMSFVQLLEGGGGNQRGGRLSRAGLVRVWDLLNRTDVKPQTGVPWEDTSPRETPMSLVADI